MTAPVTAPPGEPRCKEKCPGQGGVYCTRPPEHDGGHLDHVMDVYWPSAAAQAAS